jgi:hypothetical protein
MSWAETWALTYELALDPSSHVGAALGGLGHPVDLSTVVLADLWDLTYQKATSGKGKKPYPRAWTPRRRTKAPVLSQERIRSVLRARGHDV